MSMCMHVYASSFRGHSTSGGWQQVMYSTRGG